MPVAQRLGSRRLLACAVALGVLFTASPAGHVATARAAPATLAVTGFESEQDPLTAIDRSAGALTTVGVDGVNLIDGGTAVSAPDASVSRRLARAHADRLGAELLIGNWDDHINDFSETLAHGMLGRPAAIASVVEALAADVSKDGWQGISVDLESLAPRDTAGLVAFVRQLHAALPAGRTVSVCVTNYSIASNFPGDGYALRALGAAADRIVLMAYDQHGPWEDTPGPIGALSWQRAGLAIVLRSVPAAKLDLGQAGYGYAWRRHANLQLSDAQARRLVGRENGTARWDARAGEWTARLRDGWTVWWADARSYALRVRLAAGLHLHGLAVWSLGQADPLAPAGP